MNFWLPEACINCLSFALLAGNYVSGSKFPKPGQVALSATRAVCDAQSAPGGHTLLKPFLAQSLCHLDSRLRGNDGVLPPTPSTQRAPRRQAAATLHAGHSPRPPRPTQRLAPPAQLITHPPTTRSRPPNRHALRARPRLPTKAHLSSTRTAPCVQPQAIILHRNAVQM